jgi:acyl phosphate:glycerol-3-phosphate acyltransferase
MSTISLLWNVGALLGAYLLGSLSFAVIVSRFMGLADPRSYGSGNPGATNVLRSGSRKAALFTLVFDALKGAVPVLLALAFGPRVGIGEGAAAFIGLAAFVGHLWPVFFRLRGGKGVATAAGALLALNPPLGVLVLLTWVTVAYLWQYVSLASMAAALVAPLYQLLLWDAGTQAIAIIAMSLLLIWRHLGNLQRLLAGQEAKLGDKMGAAATRAAAAPASVQRKRKGAK